MSNTPNFSIAKMVRVLYNVDTMYKFQYSFMLKADMLKIPVFQNISQYQDHNNYLLQNSRKSLSRTVLDLE